MTVPGDKQEISFMRYCARELFVVFLKKSVSEMKFEFTAGIVFVVQQIWFRRLVHGLHVEVIVSLVPVFVCEQLRKTITIITNFVEDLILEGKTVH